MSELQAFKGDYVDLKFIKTRKVAQVHIEIAIEEAAKFVAAFGAPNPASGIPIAMARIDPNAKPTDGHRLLKGGKLAQRAGILCNEKGFQLFIAQHAHGMDGKPHEPVSAEDAATYIRALCVLNSRADLDHNHGAAAKFKDLEASYRAWLSVAA